MEGAGGAAKWKLRRKASTEGDGGDARGARPRGIRAPDPLFPPYEPAVADIGPAQEALVRRAVSFNSRLKTMPYYTTPRTSRPEIKRYTDKYRKPTEDLRGLLQKKLAAVAPEELLKNSLKELSAAKKRKAAAQVAPDAQSVFASLEKKESEGREEKEPSKKAKKGDGEEEDKDKDKDGDEEQVEDEDADADVNEEWYNEFQDDDDGGGDDDGGDVEPTY